MPKIFLPVTVILYLQMENIFIHVQNILHFLECVIFLTKTSNLPKCSCVLDCRREYSVFLVTGVEMTDSKGIKIPFIRFHNFENVRSC